MTHAGSLILAFAVLAALPAAATGQADTALEARLRNAWRIRLELTDGARMDARFRALEPSHLVIQSIVRPTYEEAYFVDRQVPLDSLARIWIVAGSHVRSGAIVGGIVLGSLGLAVGIATVQDGDAGRNCAPALCLAGGTLGGGLVGMLVGGAFGALFPRWVTVWRR